MQNFIIFPVLGVFATNKYVICTVLILVIVVVIS